MAIVTVLGIDSLCLFIKIPVPKLKVISNHRVLFGEILGVRLDKIVVTFQGIEDIVGKVGTEPVIKSLLKTCNVIEGVRVLIVRGNITSPKDNVWLHFIVNNVSHLSNYVNRDITAECAQRTSLKGLIGGVSVGCSAADHIATDLGCTSAVKQVHVNVGEVHELHGGSLLSIGISSYLLIQIVNKIVICDDSRLVSKNISDVLLWIQFLVLGVVRGTEVEYVCAHVAVLKVQLEKIINN